MDARDRARTDLYLAQLRSQSAPNTPGFAQTPRAAGFPTATTPRTPGFPTVNKGMAEKSDYESPTQYISATPNSNTTQSPFKLQAPPIRVHHASPKPDGDGFDPPNSYSPPPPASSPPPQERINEHVQAAPGEQTYEAVPIPGAYAAHRPQSPGQAY